MSDENNDFLNDDQYTDDNETSSPNKDNIDNESEVISFDNSEIYNSAEGYNCHAAETKKRNFSWKTLDFSKSKC